MSFREKMHWVSLIAILGGFGWYFISVFYGNGSGQAGHDQYPGLLILVICGIIATMSVSAIILVITNIGDVNAREDERDKIIHAKGASAAYYILLLGIWACITATYAGRSMFFLMNLLLAITIISEIICIGTQLFYYRRGY